MDVLCLDCEESFVKLLQKQHKVFSESLGCKTGIRDLKTPPHEVDVIVFNLQQPACFDSKKWGMGGNDNYQGGDLGLRRA